MVLLVALLLTVCLANMNLNYYGATCPDNSSFLVKSSIANSDKQDVASICNFIFVILAILVSLFYRRRQARTAETARRDVVMISHYTVMVEGLPKDETVDEIKAYFEMLTGKPSSVAKVAVASDITEYMELLERRDKLSKMIAEVDRLLAARERRKEERNSFVKDYVKGWLSDIFCQILVMIFGPILIFLCFIYVFKMIPYGLSNLLHICRRRDPEKMRKQLAGILEKIEELETKSSFKFIGTAFITFSTQAGIF